MQINSNLMKPIDKIVMKFLKQFYVLSIQSVTWAICNAVAIRRIIEYTTIRLLQQRKVI